jgi:hypothetical protein
LGDEQLHAPQLLVGLLRLVELLRRLALVGIVGLVELLGFAWWLLGQQLARPLAPRRIVALVN